MNIITVDERSSPGEHLNEQFKPLADISSNWKITNTIAYGSTTTESAKYLTSSENLFAALCAPAGR